MAEVHDAAPSTAGSWVVPVVRGILALVPAVVITFNQDHSPALGLGVFGWWAVVAGAVVGALTLRLQPDRVVRGVSTVTAVVTVVAGILALSLGSSLPVLLYLVSVWAAVTGFAELYLGVRGRGRAPEARDWTTVGAFTALLAVLFLLLPPDAVTAVGFLGVYFVIIGVALLIGGFSLKWAANRPASDASPASPAAASEASAPETEQS
ncbi:hypothetical protein FLP10_09150 [Agromyces intestinalis]|uniref:DUF308 domain-containing protein n=1 Tax=Agromyces intestinalis TaxID=2592652 RepID=A0A5C1YG05_9MICO|nr:DUF308 domain-containing protein [Agromyces intestinalis]QEO14568.1 hypothetical protein FLP10_09150 [Agromyces intestinalis]